MRIAIDTNRYVDFAKGLPEAVEERRRHKHPFSEVAPVSPLSQRRVAGSTPAPGSSISNSYEEAKFPTFGRVDSM